MSIFDNIIATFDVATDLVKEVVSDAIQDGAEKILDSVDLAERRAYRKLDKFEDKASAVFGVDKYANSSLAERFNHVFFSGQTERKTKIEYGDIIGVDRGLYQHYAVYIGSNRVIHYSGTGNDFGLNIKIREDDMSVFLNGSKEYFVFDCETKGKHKLKANPSLMTGALSLDHFFSIFDFRELLEVYNPEETVARAKSKLGENKYNLALNNCEHFAIWCKTGIYKSTQVDKILKILMPVPLKFIKIL